MPAPQMPPGGAPDRDMLARILSGAMGDDRSLGQVFQQSPLYGGGGGASQIQPGRQSSNVEIGEPVGQVTWDDLAHAMPGSLSDFDALHKNHLMNPQPMAGQSPALAQQIHTMGGGAAPGGGAMLRQMQDPASAYAQPFDPSGQPPPAGFGSPNPLNWEQLAARPGLQMAPWKIGGSY